MVLGWSAQKWYCCKTCNNAGWRIDMNCKCCNKRRCRRRHVVHPRLEQDIMPCLWQMNNASAMLCLPRAIAAPSSGQYWLLNRTTVLSSIVLLCKKLMIVSASTYWHFGSSLVYRYTLSRPQDSSGSRLWSPNLSTVHLQSWPEYTTAAACWQ